MPNQSVPSLSWDVIHDSTHSGGGAVQPLTVRKPSKRVLHSRVGDGEVVIFDFIWLLGGRARPSPYIAIQKIIHFGRGITYCVINGSVAI